MFNSKDLMVYRVTISLCFSSKVLGVALRAAQISTMGVSKCVVLADGKTSTRVKEQAASIGESSI